MPVDLELSFHVDRKTNEEHGMMINQNIAPSDYRRVPQALAAENLESTHVANCRNEHIDLTHSEVDRERNKLADHAAESNLNRCCRRV